VARAASSSAATSATPSKRKSKHHDSSAKKSAKNKRSNKSTIDSDAAMATQLQEQYYNDPLSTFGNNQASLPPAAAGYSNVSAGTKRPYKNCNQTSNVKVKAEPKSPTRPAKDDSNQPRDFKESAMVEQLRNMGFTDMREMLSGIRAITPDDGSLFIPNQWNQQQQVEAAMMWIVNQREEAAEAQKLDEARVSSEMANRAIEHSRREETERQMKYSDLNSLFGSLERGSITSRYFPNSVLLNNVEVRKVLHAIGNGPGKDASIKLLQLEAKAKKWYGTLPYAYFKYSVCPCFEAWSREFIVSSKNLNAVSVTILIQKVEHESKDLEQGMYNLSEQDQGCFGAPKLFLNAQRDAEAKGLSVCGGASGSEDGDVMILQCTSSSRQSIESTTCNVVDVIEIS
jgi:hypothetical protein